MEGDSTAAALIWCPFPDRDSALKIANSLLDDRLIVCANILPDMISIFVWDGKRDRAEETGVLLKTNSLLLEKAIARLEQLHPYDTPAIAGWRCDGCSPATAVWLAGMGA